MMKDPNKVCDEQLEHWLQQPLPGDNPTSHLREKLHQIPDQFSQPELHNSSSRMEIARSWLFPALATFASIMGVVVGSLGLPEGMTEQNLLAALLYGYPSLSGISL